MYSRWFPAIDVLTEGVLDAVVIPICPFAAVLLLLLLLLLLPLLLPDPLEFILVAAGDVVIVAGEVVGDVTLVPDVLLLAATAAAVTAVAAVAAVTAVAAVAAVTAVAAVVIMAAVLFDVVVSAASVTPPNNITTAPVIRHYYSACNTTLL